MEPEGLRLLRLAGFHGLRCVAVDASGKLRLTAVNLYPDYLYPDLAHLDLPHAPCVTIPTWPQAKCAAHSLLGLATAWNRRTAVEARTALLRRVADDGALLLSPHFPAPGMGTVVWAGDSFAYEPCDA